MAAVPGWDLLTCEHRAWLISQWRRTGWGDNERIAADFAARLRADPDNTVEPPSPVTLWRWARAQRQRADQVRLLAEVNAALLEALPDADAAMRQRVAQFTELRLVNDLNLLEGAENLDPIARLDASTRAYTAATAAQRLELERDRLALTRARFEADQAARAEERAKAADAASTEARALGVSPDGIAALRAAIQGAM